MKLARFLEPLRKELVNDWIDAVFTSYPAQSRPLLKGNSDPFTNPVAGMVREAAEILVTALSGEDVEIDEVKKALERFVKIRAVQEFTPSESMGVIYLLKPILRKRLLPAMQKASKLDEYLELESRLDSLALLAFDMYMRDRETLAEIRIKEIRDQYAQLKRWAQHLNAQAPLGEFVGCGKQ